MTTSTTPRPAAEKTPPGAMGLIALLLAAAFVMVLNETLMSVALPTLMKDLHLSATTGQWLTTGYMLVMAIVIPTTGFLLQRFPMRRLFAVAMSLFLLGTLTGALANGFLMLLIGRVLQAGGTAFILPLLMTTVMTMIPEQRRGRIMGSMTIVIAVAPAVGPTLSGFILSKLDWHWLFWVVLPFAALAFIAGVWRMRSPETLTEAKVDPFSVVLSALGFGGLVYGLSSIGDSSGSAFISPWLALGIGIAALLAFGARQFVLQRADRALLDLRTFRSTSFVLAFVMIAVSMMAMFGSIIVLPLYLQNVLGEDTVTVGLATLPGGLAMGLLGPVIGRLFDRYGPRPLVIPGAVVVSAALWVMTTFGAGTPLGYVIATQTVLMAAIGAMLTPLMTVALGSVRKELYSHGSAMVSTVQQLAAAAGSALFVTVMSTFTTPIGPGHGPEAAVADGVHAAFLCGAVISLIALVLSVFIRRPAKQEDSEAGEEQPAMAAH
ncbi:MDR family MFS transporter [Sciscionella sediminilitoris]|uniref:MDR family MFS transporter n=1 Tax=Sciscionella sediminilitoris TaxID=1445613 RepID=UPI00056C5636|nr:MDR family MFS transporter [Sciscionella sp. SE31]